MAVSTIEYVVIERRRFERILGAAEAVRNEWGAESRVGLIEGDLDDAAKAALLAFAPSADAATITEEDVEAGAVALAGAPSVIAFKNSWRDAEIAHYRRKSRACLEAVAAARQRATGSGVTK